MPPRSPQTRENWAILGLIALTILLLIALARIQQADGNEPNRVERYECGRAAGLHDSQPGYRIIEHAHYTEAEDGSGTLWCGNVRMVIVGVPW